MYRVIFINQSGERAQVCVDINTTTSNFQIDDEGQDDNTRADSGETVTFWWRNDGNPCRRCESSNPPCSQHVFVMLDYDITINLGDGKWAKQTV